MEYREYKPDPHLSGYVECYWSAFAESPPFREVESLIPDGTIEMMFNFGDNYSRIADGKKKVIRGSHIIGIRKQALRISQTSRQNFFCIRFKPGGMFPFFKIPVHLYSNRFFALEELIGSEYKTIEEKLFLAQNNEVRIRLVNEYLLKKLNTCIEDYKFVNTCLRMMSRDGHIQINGLAETLNTNYKTVERKFRKVVGLTPSHYLKIRRFNKALYTIYSCQYSTLTQAALESGYYDQSHFIREFKQLTDYTPGEFLKEQFTIVEVIQPALAERLSKSYNL